VATEVVAAAAAVAVEAATKPSNPELPDEANRPCSV
jgi:hypothetical protein